ncbi:MAG: acyltransferase family protein [Actinomycetota bacterium]
MVRATAIIASVAKIRTSLDGTGPAPRDVASSTGAYDVAPEIDATTSEADPADAGTDASTSSNPPSAVDHSTDTTTRTADPGPDGTASTPARTIAYQPALDGVRALAVAAVLLFHAEVPGFDGGYLGVSVFFTLSGYLITSLLAAEMERDGRIALGSFYARRARRLVPASLLVVVLVVMATVVTDWFDAVDSIRAHAIGSLLQVANWVFLAGDGSYQELLQQSAGAASPLEHYWSLAIEEQFYWLWPIAFVLLWRAGRTNRGRILVVGAITAVAAVAAPVIAVVWGADAAYWSTPARAAEILLGALAALVLRRRSVPVSWWVLAPIALVVLAGSVVLFPTVGGPAYAGALPLIGLVSTALIVGLQARSRVVDGLSAPSLVWLGTISYGVYLFHWPIFVVVDEHRLGIGGPVLFAVRIVLTLAIAQASFVLVERPIRHGVRVTPRRALVAAGGATAAAVAFAAVVLPAPRGTYWEAADETVAAAAIVVDDTPLLALDPAAPADIDDDVDDDLEASGASEADGGRAVAVDVGSAADDAASGDAASGVGVSGDAASVGDVATDGAGGTSDDGNAAAAVGSAEAPATADAERADAQTTESNVEPDTDPEPLPTPARPVRVIVGGDSTADAFGAGVVGWAAANPDLAQAEVEAFAGCGFVRGGEMLAGGEWIEYQPGCGRFHHELLPERAAEAAADVVVLMTSSWDVLDRRWSEDGEQLTPAEYEDRIVSEFSSVTEALLDAGVPMVVWSEMPTSDPEWSDDENVSEDPDRHAVLHRSMAVVAARFPGRVEVIDFDGWFTSVGLDEDRDVRPDGVHVTTDAAVDIVDAWLGERILRAVLT